MICKREAQFLVLALSFQKKLSRLATTLAFKKVVGFVSRYLVHKN